MHPLSHTSWSVSQHNRKCKLVYTHHVCVACDWCGGSLQLLGHLGHVNSYCNQLSGSTDEDLFHINHSHSEHFFAATASSHDKPMAWLQQCLRDISICVHRHTYIHSFRICNIYISESMTLHSTADIDHCLLQWLQMQYLLAKPKDYADHAWKIHCRQSPHVSSPKWSRETLENDAGLGQPVQHFTLRARSCPFDAHSEGRLLLGKAAGTATLAVEVAWWPATALTSNEYRWWTASGTSRMAPLGMNNPIYEQRQKSQSDAGFTAWWIMSKPRKGFSEPSIYNRPSREFDAAMRCMYSCPSLGLEACSAPAKGSVGPGVHMNRYVHNMVIKLISESWRSLVSNSLLHTLMRTGSYITSETLSN